MNIIDTHAHYDHRQYDKDREQVLATMPQNGVDAVVNVGCDLKSSKVSVALAEAHPFVYATVGVHPHDAKSLTEQGLQSLKKLCSTKKVVAYGEIGLDFYHNFSEPDVQRYWFKRQLELAGEVGKPVVIHTRDAAEETYDLIKNSYANTRGGVVHSFSGDAKLAHLYIDLGFYIGIGGVITFDKTSRMQSVVEAIPLDKILLETDAPYLTPVPFRGKRNNSSYLLHVVAAIAKIKGLSCEDVCVKTSENARKLFNIV